MLYTSIVHDAFPFIVDIIEDHWIRASFHVTPHKEWFATFYGSKEGCVILGNNYDCESTKVGGVLIYLLTMVHPL